jgi:Ca2+-binding RTX toxin-like protein
MNGVNRGFAGILVSLGLIGAQSASAAELFVREGPGANAVTYRAEAGEQNEVAIIAFFQAGEWVVEVQDAGLLTLGPGCTSSPGGAVCMTGEERAQFDAELGDKDDEFDGRGWIVKGQRGPGRVSVDGGLDNDEITSDTYASCLSGQEGDDIIRFTASPVRTSGRCISQGDAGDDRIIGSVEQDYAWGGSGHDVLVGRGGGDYLEGGDDMDSLDGGAGPDVMRGSDGDDKLFGGDGDDDLGPGFGADEVQGGVGDDLLTVAYNTLKGEPGEPTASPDGRDLLLGGPGLDEAFYLCGGCRIRLDSKANDGLPGEGDLLKVEHLDVHSQIGADEEFLSYGPGHDRLEGSDVAEKIIGNLGDDVLIGRGGNDELDAGAGNDVVNATDGVRDQVLCGQGNDQVIADPIDVLRDCETVGFPSPR